ncbi:Jag N-terminal domain-containing protein [Aerococcaceae bacterium DSM 111020]|nr:Jag N-terminal domain-containing protein [Aerococcaceae bacterium DSM 111020]
MMLNHKTVRAATVEEAVEIGLKQLGISREQAEIRVINEGKKGFLGFGKQEAIVEIHKLNDMSLSQLTQELERQDDHNIEDYNINEKIEVNQPLQSEPDLTSSEDEIKDSQDDVDNTISEPIVSATELKHDVDTHLDDKVNREEEIIEDSLSNYAETDSVEDTNEELIADAADHTDEGEQEYFQGKNAYESAEIVADYLVDIIQDYGADASIEMDIEGKNVFFDIHTDKSGLVIGKHGKIINSLQILAQTYLSAIHQKHLNVILNVGDYRKRRAKVLQNIAEQKAEEAKNTGQPAVVEPLPAYERKQIHKHLSHMKSFKTYSQGREPKRQLVIEYVSIDDENYY